MTEILLVAQMMLAAAGLASSARGSGGDAPPLQVTIVSEPWAAPFTAAGLASAVRLRLPRARVAVVAAAPPAGGSGTSVTVRWLATPALRVERGTGDAVEFPLGDAGRAGASPADDARRAALFVALFAEQGAPLPPIEPPGSSVAAPSRERPASPESPPAAIAPAPPAPVAPPASGARSPDRGVRGRWSVSAYVGSALAFEEGIASPEALTVRFRRYLSPRTAVELGGKLSGEYPATVESQSIGVSDRALFAGMAYEAGLSRTLSLDLGAALQYTGSVADVDGAGPVTDLTTPTGARLAVRTSVGVAWSPAEHVTAGVSVSPSFSLREREYVDQAGREVLELGSMIVDVSVGASVRW